MNTIITFELIDRPTHPVALPEWVCGAGVDWHEKYANDPTIKLFCSEWPKWKDPVFIKAGDFYIATHEDGRINCLKHDGAIAMRMHRVWVTEDGRVSLRHIPHTKGTWEERSMLSTTEQNGFGGDRYQIKLNDGRELILWGPWAAGNPSGYQESVLYKRGERTGMGQAFSHDLLVRAVSRYLPHLEIAMVRHPSGRVEVEPLRKEDDYLPKAVRRELADRARDLILKDVK